MNYSIRIQDDLKEWFDRFSKNKFNIDKINSYIWIRKRKAPAPVHIRKVIIWI